MSKTITLIKKFNYQQAVENKRVVIDLARSLLLFGC